MIWLKWKKDALIRQIEYGASLGELNLKHATTDLKHYFYNEEDIIKYYQQRRVLYEVGEKYQK